MNDKNAVEVRELWFRYENTWILENINLDIPHGDFLAILGPNGSGKTTLIKLILGILSPNKGTISIYGEPPKKACKFIGYMPQYLSYPANLPLKVMDVVLMGCIKEHSFMGFYSKKNKLDALNTLELLSITHLKDRLMTSLSQGQRQRVLIARALVSRPKILFLDEPTSNIDERGKCGFFELLRELNKEITIVVISHDIGVISRYVKSIACVNRNLFYHSRPDISKDVITNVYGSLMDGSCNLDLLYHGNPHRIRNLDNHS